jgi:hypothetical protein
MLSDNTVLDTLGPLLAPGDAVYSTQRSKRRPWWKSFLDVCVSGGAIGDLFDINDNLSTPYYLVAGDTSAYVARLGQAPGEGIVETIPVPGWSPAAKDSFKSVTVDGYEYRKVTRLA